MMSAAQKNKTFKMALFLLSAVFALSAAATPAVNLSNIVLPVQPTAAEQAAARELEIHLKRLTGKNIVVGRWGEIIRFGDLSGKYGIRQSRRNQMYRF